VITSAQIHGPMGARDLLAGCKDAPRGTPARVVSAGDLLEIGRCPARWVNTPEVEDFDAEHGATLLEVLALAPDLAQRWYVRRPDTYEAMLLRCPRCNSAGPAASCKKCGVRRRNVVEPRVWSTAAKQCATWQEEQEGRGRRTIAGPEYDRAAMGAAQLARDPAIMGLAEKGQVLPLAVGEWHDDATGLKIPVRARATIIPVEGHAMDNTVATVVPVRNADPTMWAAGIGAMGSHIRAALLVALANAAQPVPRTEVLWVLVEKEPPRIVARRRPAPEVLMDGRRLLELLLASYAHCLRTGKWPAFEDPGPAALDAWTRTAMEPWMTGGQGTDGGYFAPAVTVGKPARRKVNGF
jgi:hypothetical protein